MEEWRDVVGYDGLYQVSDTGKVRSMYFKNNHVFKPRIKEMQIYTNKHRRCYVSIHKDGIRKNATVHRLVAIAFIPNPNNLPEVNHIDGNPSNNHVNNLEWCTKRQNLKHEYDHNLNKFKARNEKNSKPVVRDDGVIYESTRACARAMGVTQSAIKDILHGRKQVKTCKGHKFAYVSASGKGDL